MGLWSFVLPEATTNLISNPSFEIATTGWMAVGGSIARSSAKQTKGLYSLAVTPTGAGDGVYCALTLEATTEYTFSIDVWGAAGVDYRIYIYDVTAAAILGSAVAFEADGNWRRYLVTATTGANTSIRVCVEVVDASTADFYIDAAQVEAKGYATIYCDGDQDGCSWAAGAYTSTSSRSAQSAAGGRVIDLNSSGYEFEVKASIGVGHAPVEVIDTLPAQGIGGDFQDQVIRPRDFQLAGTIPGTDRADYHTNRLNLIRAFSPHRLATKQPVQIRYSLSQRSVAIDGYYVDGLGKNQQAGPTLEEIALRFRAENPLFRAITGHNNADRCGGQGATLASVQESVDQADYVIVRESGDWNAVGDGANATVRTILFGNLQDIYIGGSITLVGFPGYSTAVGYVAKWDGMAWDDLNGGFSSSVYMLNFGPDSQLYACGLFTTANGGALTPANRVAVYDGSSWSALGSGLNSGVLTMAWGPDGCLYVGGGFTTAGGNPANRVAKWDPSTSTWSALGSGLNNDVYAMAWGPDGCLYVGGDFTTAGGGAANRVAKWDPATSTWSALGSGFNNTVKAIDVGPDGIVYAGGIFTTADGNSIVGIAQWTGSAWVAVGGDISGHTLGVLKIRVDQETGVVYAGGDFTSIGNLTPPDSIARWEGTRWFAVDVDLPGAAGSIFVSGIDIQPDKLGIGFSGSGTATASALTTVTNNGSANSYPIIKIIGPGQIYTLINYTTGEEIFFNNLTLVDGETVILDLRPGKKTFTSSFRGNIINAIVEGSDVESFHLMPGENSISLLIDDASAEAFLLWDESHMSIDGVVA